MEIELIKIMKKGSSIIVNKDIYSAKQELEKIEGQFSFEKLTNEFTKVTKTNNRKYMNTTESILKQINDWSGYNQHTGKQPIINGKESTIRCVVSKFNKMNNDVFRVVKTENGITLFKDVKKIIAKESITEDEYTLYNLQRLDENKIMMDKVVRREIIPVSHEKDLKHEVPEYQVDDEPTMEDDPEDFDGSPVLFDDNDDDDDDISEDYYEIDMMDQIID